MISRVAVEASRLNDTEGARSMEELYEEREAARCPFLRQHGDHDWRVNPNQVISGGQVVNVRVLCPHCRTGTEKQARRSYRSIDPSKPETWRPFRQG